MTENNIESLLQEDRSFEPPVEFASAARVGSREEYDAVRSKAAADPEAFWASIAEELHWFRKWDEVLDWSNPPFAKWFVGAKTNISHNCLDRNLDRVHHACGRRAEAWARYIIVLLLSASPWYIVIDRPAIRREEIDLRRRPPRPCC